MGNKVDGSRRDFLAISDAKAFKEEECETWTYYVPKEKENSEWELFHVLLVEMTDRIWYVLLWGRCLSKGSRMQLVGRGGGSLF